MATIRAFIAIDLPDHIRHGLGEQIRRLRQAMPDTPIRWVRPEAIHLTLRFLGDTDLELVAGLKQGLASLGRANGGFPIKVGGIGCFPNGRRPRVVWIGVEEKTGALTELQRSVEAFCRELGYPPERREFSPHLTLGRVRRGGETQTGVKLGRFIEMDRSTSLGEAPVEEVILFESLLRPEGAVYRRLATARLERDR